MPNDVGTEDLPGEDWRSKAEAKGVTGLRDRIGAGGVIEMGSRV